VRRLGLPAVFVFVDTPSREDLARRLEGRGSDPQERDRRLREADRERAERARYDAVVVNGDLERAYAEFTATLARLGIGGKRKETTASWKKKD
jgi:guanylate kinase